MTVERTVAVELLAKVSGYTAGMLASADATERAAAAMTVAARAQTQLERAQRTGTTATTANTKAQTQAAAAAKSHAASLNTVGKGFLAVGIVAAAGLGLATKASLDFNREMATVGTLAHANAADLQALSAAALTVGQRFGYTATKVTEAEQELVKAGISIKDILGGALTGTLTLAAAGQTDLATATEIAASAMTQFQLSGKDVPHIADLLAAGADKALGSVADLGLGLSQVGTTAHQFGFSLDDTVAILAEFAQQGQIGQKAGTELNQALLQLAAPTKQASALMQKYGFNVYTASGHFVTFDQLAGRLQKSFSGLTAAQRNQALATIFGSRAIRAANILLTDGAAGVKDWQKRVNDAGFATLQAAGKLNSLSGDLSKLKAAFQTGLIETGDSAQGSLRGLTQEVTSLIEVYNSLSPRQKSIVTDIAGVTAGVGLLAGGLILVVPKVVEFSKALQTITKTQSTGAAIKSLATFVRGPYGIALAAGTLAVGLFVKSHLDAAERVADLTSAIEADSGAIGENTRQTIVNNLAKEGALKDARELGLNLTDVTDAALGNAKAQAAITDALNTQRAQRTQAIKDGSITASQGQDQLDTTGDLLRILGLQNSALTKAKTAAGDQAAAMGKSAAATMAAAQASDQLSTSVSLVNGQIKSSTLDVTLLDKALTNLTNAFDVQAETDQMTTGFKDLAKQIAKTSATTKGNSDAAIANRNALRDQYKVAVSIVKSYADQTDAQGHLVHSAADVQKKAKEVTKSFKDQATQAGLSKTSIKTYVDKLKTVPGQVTTNVQVTGLGAATQAVSSYKSLVDGVRFKVIADFRAMERASESGTPGGYRGGQLDNGRFNYSDGGRVFGGPPGRDTVRANLDNGEIVIRKQQAAKHRRLLLAINRGDEGFAQGGIVGKLSAVRGYAGGGQVAPNLSDIFSLVSDALSKKHHPSTATAFTQAEKRTDKIDAAFVANLDKIAARGFGYLAMQLLDSGDANAKAVAKKAANWPAAKLATAQRDLQRSAAQQKRLGLLPAELAISSALRTGKNPTLASIAAATGIDTSDLQAGLIAMQKSLRGNKNAGRLLAGLNSVGTYSQSSWGATTAQMGPTYQVTVQTTTRNPYSVGEKVGVGIQRVLTAGSGSFNVN